MRTTTLVAIGVAAAFMAMAAPAGALYMVTPLSLEAPADHADAGDDVEFTVGPHRDNQTAKKDWADKKVHVGFGYDLNEGQGSEDPDAPASDTGHVEKHIREIQLDSDARGSFTWTVPAEADGKNVVVFIEDADGQRLAFAFLAVGDAEPQMHILAANDGEAPEAGQDSGGEQSEAASPGVGAIALVASLGLAAMGVATHARRR